MPNLELRRPSENCFIAYFSFKSFYPSNILGLPSAWSMVNSVNNFSSSVPKLSINLEPCCVFCNYVCMAMMNFFGKIYFLRSVIKASIIL